MWFCYIRAIHIFSFYEFVQTKPLAHIPPYYLALLHKYLIMPIQTGQQAPQFKLFSSELKEVSLNDFLGKKVVIHFFPMAFTGTCTTQLCTMRDNFGYYEDMNAVILGISVDSPFTLAKFKEDNNYQFSLLSDFNKEASKAYEAFYEEFVFGLKGVSKRAAFVLDETHKVVYAEVLDVATELPDFNAIAHHVR
jgi:peroxiredoxin